MIFKITSSILISSFFIAMSCLASSKESSKVPGKIRAPSSAFTPLQRAEIAITKGDVSVPDVAPSISVSFYGSHAQAVFELLRSQKNSIETKETWGVTVSTEDKEVVCGESTDPKGKKFYNCGISHTL